MIVGGALAVLSGYGVLMFCFGYFAGGGGRR